MNELPKHIGGLQHLAPGISTEPDDLLVRDGKPICFLRQHIVLEHAMSVREAEDRGFGNIYRRIPCPRQGGERPETELGAILRETAKITDAAGVCSLPAFKLAPDGTKLWRSKDGSYSPSGFMDDGPNELTPAAHNEVARKQANDAASLVIGTLPTDAKARKQVPLACGLLDYFPDALCAVAELSRIGNEQHNPGKPLHWDRSKSGDEADALMRHLLERDGVDSDGVPHAVKVAWRGLALAQKKIEAMRAVK